MCIEKCDTLLYNISTDRNKALFVTVHQKLSIYVRETAMKMLIDDIKLNLLLEQKKNYIGKTVVWDSILSSSSFLVSTIFASYGDIWIINGLVFKVLFIIAGIFFTIKAVLDVHNSLKNSYSYADLLEDINKLNEITHNHTIVAIRDTFNEYSNRFLVYDDPKWGCKLFVNYKDNVNNENFIKDHLSRAFKVDIADIKVSYISQIISEKVSGRDNKRKVYCHKLFLIELEKFPKNMTQKTFVCDGLTYYWKSITELENDNEAMEKNADIIQFVKENI